MENAFYERILLSAPFGYGYHKILSDENGLPIDYIFLDVNPMFESITGLQKNAIIGKQVTEVIPGIRNAGFDWVAMYGKVALTGETLEFTQYAEPLRKWYKVTALSTQKEYFITYFQDVTVEVENINALEEQKKEITTLSRDLETIFNSTHDAMFLVGVHNDELKYIRNNAAHQRMTGIASSEIAEKSPSELVGRQIGDIIYQNYMKCIDAGKSITYEEKLTLPSGERSWLTSLVPVIENGKATYIVGSSKDITLQKKAEEEVTSLAVRMRAMFNGHNAVMMLVEPVSGRIIDINQAASDFYGYTQDELLGMKIQDINILPPEEVRRMRMMAAKDKQKYFVFPHRLKSGEVKKVDVYSCPILIDNENMLFSIIFDVTDRENNKEELFREKELLKITLQSIGDGVVTTDCNGIITSLNEAAMDISKWKGSSAINERFVDVFRLINEETGLISEDPIQKVLQTGKVVGLANHTVLIDKKGQQVPIADSAAPIKDENGQVYGAVLVFRDVSQERIHQNKIEYLSLHDHLTDLYNRRYMEQEMEYFDAERFFPLSVIMGDVNGLKLTNDVFGHETGDLLLQKVGDILKTSCRKDDIVARWGGDEFLILLPQTTLVTAEHIIQRIKERSSVNSSGAMQLSISLGSATKTKSEIPLVQILKEAEESMYTQKLLDGKSYRNAITSILLSTLYERSSETKEHAERLRDSCHSIGKKLNLSIKDLDDLTLLAILHDIGKVGINENVLKKPGKLSESEWDEMKKHPIVGCRIAQSTPELNNIADYILCHHEHWDGTGYPRGLAGEKIPVLCRILAVADAYDAMVNNRPYRKAMSKEAAAVEIQNNAGTQFDPRVVNIFLNIV